MGTKKLSMTLTSRERDVIALIARGMKNKQIASELDLSENAVRNHVATLLRRYGLHTRTQLAISYRMESLSDAETPMRKGWRPKWKF